MKLKMHEAASKAERIRASRGSKWSRPESRPESAGCSRDEMMDEAASKAERIRASRGNYEAEISFTGEAGLHQCLLWCDKNPGHHNFIPTNNLNIKHLPSRYRDNLLVDYVRATSDLTCRLSVSRISEDRPETFPDSRQTFPFSNVKGEKFETVGTGWVHHVEKYTEGGFLYPGSCECDECLSSHTPKKICGKVHITTANHVVFNTEEARHTKCQFFYDSPETDIDKVLTLTGLKVNRSDIKEDGCTKQISVGTWKKRQVVEKYDFDLGKECSFKETLTKQIPKQWNGAEHLNSLFNESPAFKQSYGNEFLITNNKNTRRSESLQQRLFCLLLKRVTSCLLHNISQLSYLIRIRCPDLWDIFINRWGFQVLRGGCQEEWEVFFLLIKSPDRLLVWGSSVTGPNLQSEYIKMFTNTNDISNHYINRKCMPRDQIVLQAGGMHGVEDKASAQESDANSENEQAFEKQCMNKEEHVADVDSRKGTVEEWDTDEPSNEEESQYGITGCHETVNSNTSDLQADAINPDTPDQMQNGKADSHDGDHQRDFEGSVKEDEADNNCYSSQDDVALIESEAPDVATEEENVSKGSAVLEEVTAKVSDSTKKLKISDESFGTTLPESGKNEQTDVDSGRAFTSKGDRIKLGKQKESIRAVVFNDYVNQHSSRRRPNYLPHDEVETVKSRVKAISRFLEEERDLGQPQLSDNIRFSSFMKLSADGSLPESWYKDMYSLRRSFTQQDLMMYPLERFDTTSTPRKHPAKILGIPWEDFERETMRLASFSRYPIDANKSSTLLAESGFVYIGDGMNDKVICFYCHLTKENWRSHEDIGDVHKAGSPHCPMVITLTSNNSATTTEASAASSSARAVTYSSASGPTRGRGFSSLPSSYASAGVEDEVDIPPRGHRPPTSMPHVQAGQQSIGNTSSATPYTTNGASATARHQLQAGIATHRRGTQQQQQSSQQATPNHQDERQDDSQQNRAHHPNINSQIYSIPRNPDNDTSTTTTTTSQSAQVVNGSNSTTGSSDQPRSLNYRDLGILCERPKHPELAVIVNRVLTYDGWPQDHHLRPDDLAKAGFHYAGYADCCKCFFCGGGLRKWDLEDDPYVEHARWFPKCGYIRQLLGDDFIVAVQELKGQALETITMKMVKDLMKARGMDLKNQFDDGKVEDDAAVKSLIDEGYDRDMVYRVATDLKNSGVALSADVILEKINATTQPTSSVAGVDVPDSAGAGAGRNNADDEDIQELKDQNYTLRNNLICKICMDKEVRMVFLPCGHLVSCQECAVALQDCPVCRKHIRATVRASIR